MRNLWLLFLVALATGFISEKKLLVSSQSPHSTTDDMYLEGRTSGDFPVDDEDGDDDGSGSGSGDSAFGVTPDEDDLLWRFLNFSGTTVAKGRLPVQPKPTAVAPHVPQITAEDSPVRATVETQTTDLFPDGDTNNKEVIDVDPTLTHVFTSIPPSVTGDADEDNSLDRWDVSKSKDGEEKVLIKETADNEVWAKERARIYDSPEEVNSQSLWDRTEVLAAVIACGVVGFLCAVFLLVLLAYRMKKKDEGSYDLGDTKLSTTAYHKAPTKEFYA